jgi:hypothetical protein
MNKANILALALLACSSVAFAQIASVGIYSDNMGSDCNILDNTPGLLQMYVVVTNTPCVRAVEFSAPVPACMVGATWLSDTNPFPVHVGDSQNGIGIGFGADLAPPVHALTINIMAAGTSMNCCEYPILPGPTTSSGVGVQWIDCVGLFGSLLFGNGLVSTVNGDASCPCGFGEADPSFPYNPRPQSSATVPPPSVVLEWDAYDLEGGPLTYDVYFGTEFFNPGLVATEVAVNMYDPGPLPPDQYFWKIVVRDGDGNETIGPIWSFKADVPLAVEERTWGSVKWTYGDR